MRVAQKRRGEMERGRQTSGAQAARRAVARQDERVEAILQVQVLVHPDAPCERNELGAAREEDVLPVVDFVPVDFERGRAAAEEAAALEEFDVGTSFFQFEGGGQTRESGADHGYPLLLSHDLTTTRSFSVFESAARSRNGRPGSRSIFLSSSS